MNFTKLKKLYPFLAQLANASKELDLGYAPSGIEDAMNRGYDMGLLNQDAQNYYKTNMYDGIRDDDNTPFDLLIKSYLLDSDNTGNLYKLGNSTVIPPNGGNTLEDSLKYFTKEQLQDFSPAAASAMVFNNSNTPKDPNRQLADLATEIIDGDTSTEDYNANVDTDSLLSALEEEEGGIPDIWKYRNKR